MGARQPACEPCRRAKVACDHKRPTCTRCLEGRKGRACLYRASPFKRRGRSAVSAPADSPIQRPPATASSPPNPTPKRQPYLSSGYLGSSSHVAIFNHIDTIDSVGTEVNSAFTPTSTTQCLASLDLNHMAEQPAEALHQLVTRFSFALMKDLVIFWLAKGVNLALAEPLVQQCAHTMTYLEATFPTNVDNWHLGLAKHLLQNSSRPLEFCQSSTLSSFLAQFRDHNARWEVMGIFLSAVIRATFDIPYFNPLYTSYTERDELRTLATKLSDHSLSLCLSLECPNDLQLIQQYENWIVHSFLDGDHSLSSWRTLGEVIGFAFALGYHENVQSKADVPPFLAELRKTAFARLYSADKNYAILLGRPPRMSKRFCYFQIPTSRANWTENIIGPSQEPEGWDEKAKINYRAESRWTALCASLKEEILELFTNKDRSSNTLKESGILDRIEAQWQALPAHFRLDRSLKQCNRTPFECDFLISARLNYLHVQFLLRLVVLNRLAEPDDSIIELAQQMLSLVVETLLFRDSLANSGTGLLWKVAHYGLPAAGIILLAIFKHRKTASTARISRIKVWQDLSILVAEVQMGSIVQLGEPGYALFSKAAQTIQRFLESVSFEEELEKSGRVIEQPEYQPVDDLFPLLTSDPWNLEIGFWQELSEHPFLSYPDSVTEGV